MAIFVRAVLVLAACLLAGPARPAVSEPDSTVYITENGAKYHAESCKYLSGGKRAISLSKARKQGLAPCRRCQKAAVSKDAAAKEEGGKDKGWREKGSISKARCATTTKAGSRCKRAAEEGSRFCWQHKR